MQCILKLNEFFLQMSKCLDGSLAFDMSKAKGYLSLMKGTIQVKIDGEHDTVSKTGKCLWFMRKLIRILNLLGKVVHRY